MRWKHTRLQEHRNADTDPRMVSVQNGGYLMEALMLLGPVRAMPEGNLRCVDWPEIVAFSSGTKRVTEPAEIELLFEMAHNYLIGKQTGDKLLGIAPVDEGKEDDKDD